MINCGWMVEREIGRESTKAKTKERMLQFLFEMYGEASDWQASYFTEASFCRI